jgi:hypothetical protein
MQSICCAGLALAALMLTGPAQAEVADLTPQGFLVKVTTPVAATPDATYRALSTQVGQWWNSAHTYSGDARNLTLDVKAQGCFCEALPGGGSVAHMTVVYVVPGKTLRMVGGLGPLQGSGLAGSMTWSLKPEGQGTVLELQYSVGGYRQGGFEKLAPAVNGMLSEQVQRLKSLIETGAATATVR